MTFLFCAEEIDMLLLLLLSYYYSETTQHTEKEVTGDPLCTILAANYAAFVDNAFSQVKSTLVQSSAS